LQTFYCFKTATIATIVTNTQHVFYLYRYLLRNVALSSNILTCLVNNKAYNKKTLI